MARPARSADGQAGWASGLRDSEAAASVLGEVEVLFLSPSPAWHGGGGRGGRGPGQEGAAPRSASPRRLPWRGAGVRERGRGPFSPVGKLRLRERARPAASVRVGVRWGRRAPAGDPGGGSHAARLPVAAAARASLLRRRRLPRGSRPRRLGPTPTMDK